MHVKMLVRGDVGTGTRRGSCLAWSVALYGSEKGDIAYLDDRLVLSRPNIHQARALLAPLLAQVAALRLRSGLLLLAFELDAELFDPQERYCGGHSRMR